MLARLVLTIDSAFRFKTFITIINKRGVREDDIKGQIYFRAFI